MQARPSSEWGGAGGGSIKYASTSQPRGSGASGICDVYGGGQALRGIVETLCGYVRVDDDPLREFELPSHTYPIK